MAWTVTLAPAARKALKSIRDTRLRGRIFRALQGLAEEPRPSGAKRLVGLGGTLRSRVGYWRIFYEVREVVVLVVRIGPRGEVYKWVE